MNNQHYETHGHEPTDVPARPLWLTAAGLVVSCVLIGLAMIYFFNILAYRKAGNEKNSRGPVPGIAISKPQFPEPRLQTAPEVDLAALRTREDAELNSYGWIDRNAGIVRIPIERAMDLIIQRGLPVNGQPGSPKPYRTALDLQQARPLERETEMRPITK